MATNGITTDDFTSVPSAIGSDLSSSDIIGHQPTAF